MMINLENQIKAFSMLFPRGQAWEGIKDINSNLYKFAKSISRAIVDYKTLAFSLLEEMHCTTMNQTRDLWLQEYGLPNVCDPRSETLCLLANGIDIDSTLEEIVIDALDRIGLEATFLDEAVNNKPLLYSIFLNENSPAFQDCRFYAGSTASEKRICGFPFPSQRYASDPQDFLNDKTLKASDPSTYINVSCGFFAGDYGSAVDNQLYAGKSLTKLIPNLSCVFEQIIPLGFRVNFYYGDYDNPIFGV